MKSITYISRAPIRQNGATVPSDLSKIYSQARRRNFDKKITGILSYRVGYYIQVIEGEDHSVDEIYAKIEKDGRHSNPIVIFEQYINQRMFKNWSMKLLQSVDNDPSFQQFIKSNQKNITQLSSAQELLLKRFHSLKNFTLDSVKPKAVDSYAGKRVKLKRWPDYSSIKQNPTVIEFCAALVHTTLDYNAIILDRTYGSIRDVNKLLAQFEEQGLLEVLPGLPDDHNELKFGKAKPSGFYTKMKSFLGLRKSDGV